jgi:hypothetical protein
MFRIGQRNPLASACDSDTVHHMESGPTTMRQDESRTIRSNLVRRATELAMIHGRAGHQPTREDLVQAKREVKPLKLPGVRLDRSNP